MKKRNSVIAFIMIVVALFSLGFYGCKSDTEEVVDKYTITYSDGVETHTINVKYGDVYSISAPLPSKDGAIFLGLFDAEVGGMQYVTSSGECVVPFSDNQDIVLYPQFRANEYTVTLDYGDAEVTGIKRFKVERDAPFPLLPTNLFIADKNYMKFIGWYAGEYWNSVQVSGENGISMKKLDESLVRYCDGNELVLHARFEKQKYTVNFYSNDYTLIKQITVAHGDNIDDVSKGITVGDKTVLGWSKMPNGSRFSGQIEQKLNLYAVEFLNSSTVAFEVQNCADNNGYNPEQKAGEEDDQTRHNEFSIIQLTVDNAERQSDGKFIIPVDWSPLTFNLKVTRNPSNLPINNNECQIKNIESDSYTGYVTGTNISNKSIGKGAYYFKVNYSDGSKYEANATDIFNGKTQGDFIPLNIPYKNNKQIKSVQIVVVYEIYCGGPGFIFWWREYTNWRCSATLEFR